MKRYAGCTTIIGTFVCIGGSAAHGFGETNDCRFCTDCPDGLTVMLSVPYKRFSEQRLTAALMVLTFIALILVLAMPAAGGAHRWFRFGPFNLQPSEFAKLTTVVFMAGLLSRRENEVNDLWAVPMPCLGASR